MAELDAMPHGVYKIHDSGEKELYQQFSSDEERTEWLNKVRESYPHLTFKKGNLNGELEE